MSYVPMALTAGLAGSWAPHGKAVTLIPNAFATKIATTTVTGEPRANGVRGGTRSAGPRRPRRRGSSSSAGGTTENPRLWLNSGLPNPNDWVGRGYTDHYFDWLVGVFAGRHLQLPGCGLLGASGLAGPRRAGTGRPAPALQAFSLMFSNAGMQGYYNNGANATDLGGQGLTDAAWDGPAGRPMDRR